MPSLRDMPIEELLRALEATRRAMPDSETARAFERELRRREAALKAADRRKEGKP